LRQGIVGYAAILNRHCTNSSYSKLILTVID
jgi:hypothetical protein